MNNNDLIKLAALNFYTLAKMKDTDCGEDKLIIWCVKSAKQLLEKFDTYLTNEN